MGAQLIQVDWAVVLIMLPLSAAMLGFLLPGMARNIGLLAALLILFTVVGLGWQLTQTGVYSHVAGGWLAPLGIQLHADGFSLLMLATSAIVGVAVSIYSTGYFKAADDQRFWPTWLLLWAALNALFLAADVFNLYVTLELLGLSAVTLASLTGSKDSVSAAMRYLLSTLLGSLAFLLGIGLLYHQYGSVDIAILSERVNDSTVSWAALGLITAGLALKTALFPFHFWLPPAHASAPAPVSALLSALVVKASFYILLRLWLGLFDFQQDSTVANMLGILGATAVLWGSIQALRQIRLKMLVAYSTVAQIGYLFLAFPLAQTGGNRVWYAVAYLMLSHALAKAAMFLVAGNMMLFSGHDRIVNLDRVVQRLPVTVAAFGLAGVSIMGLPPSGGFIAKWLLLEAALAQGHWGIAGIMMLGGILAAAYVFKVLGYAFIPSPVPHQAVSVPARMQWMALLLATLAIMAGFVAQPLMQLIGIGALFDSTGSMP